MNMMLLFPFWIQTVLLVNKNFCTHFCAYACLSVNWFPGAIQFGEHTTHLHLLYSFHHMGCHQGSVLLCICLLLLEHVPTLVPSARLFVQRASVVVYCYFWILIIDSACKKCGLTETLFCECTTEWSLRVNSCESVSACMWLYPAGLHPACISCPCGWSDLYLLAYFLCP